MTQASSLASGKNTSTGGWVVILLFVFYIILERSIRIYNVIDFPKSCIYREFFFFGVGISYSDYKKEDIIEIGNTNIARMMSPAGKSGMIDGKRVLLNNEINLFDDFYVSFLLKDGKTLDFRFGVFREDHLESIEFVNLLSDYWNIPKIICSKNNYLEVRESRNSAYSFVEEKIAYCSSGIKILLILVYIISSMVAATALIYYLVMKEYSKQTEPTNANSPYLYQNYKRPSVRGYKSF